MMMDAAGWPIGMQPAEDSLLKTLHSTPLTTLDPSTTLAHWPGLGTFRQVLANF